MPTYTGFSTSEPSEDPSPRAFANNRDPNYSGRAERPRPGEGPTEEPNRSQAGYTYQFQTAGGGSFEIESDRILSPQEQATAALRYMKQAGQPAPPAPTPSVMDRVGQGLAAARGAVQPLADAAAKGLLGPTFSDVSPQPLAEALNPVPGDAGSAGATAASLLAAIATGGKAGFLPAALRALAPVLGSATGQYAQTGEVNPVQSAAAGIGGLVPEVGAGVVGTQRAIRGKSILQPEDRARLAKSVSIPGRQVAPTAEDIALAGEAKGQPGSLATVADQRFKRTVQHVGQVGDQLQMTVMRPSGIVGPDGQPQMVPQQVPLLIELADGRQVPVSEALDVIANQRMKGAPQGAPTKQGGGQRAEALLNYDALDAQLRQAGAPQLADMVKTARGQLAEEMSKHRLVEQARSRGLIDEKGNVDMRKVQDRFDELVDAKKQGKAGIATGVRGGLENAVRRGEPGVGKDTAGAFKLPFVRLSGHGVTGGENLGNLVHIKLPSFVGTPENLAAVLPPEGMSRNLLSIGGLLSEEAARRGLEGRGR